MKKSNYPPIEERLTYNTYMEGDKMVQTELKHMGRGHCCGNSCRHCPYWPKYQSGNRSIKESIRVLFDSLYGDLEEE